MKLAVTSNSEQVSRFFREIMSDQAPFAVSKAINTTVLQAQEAQRTHQRDVFHVRVPFFVDRAVKIKPFARKHTPFAVIQIDPPGGEARREVIARHEEDRKRTPREGKALLVPRTTGRERKIIRRSNKLHPSKWGMRRMDSGTGGRREVWRGKRGLYMIRHADGSGTVYQRTGPGTHGTHAGSVVVFRLVPETPLDPELSFVENVTRIVDENWEDNIAEAWDLALRTAR